MIKEVSVLIVEYGKQVVNLIDILPDYPTIREIICGDVIEVHLEDEVVILCSDYYALQVIREFGPKAIMGKCFIVIGKESDGKYKSLTAKEINKYKSEFEGYCPLEVR